MNPQEADRAVYLAPNITPNERRELALAAERIKASIAQNIELRESVNLLALHQIEARRPPLGAPKFDVPAIEAVRQDDHLRGLLTGVQAMADCLTDTARLNELLIAIEHKDT